MKKQLLIVLLAGFAFTGCTESMLSTPTPAAQTAYIQNYEDAPAAKIEAYEKKKRIVGLSTKQDSNYKSFGPDLNTPEKKAWFNNLMYRLWDRQITKSQFIAEGLKRFPNRKYEFTFVANGF